MKKIGVFYGTTSGTTAGVVDELEFYLRKNDYEVHNVADGISSLSEYENLILVTPTYGVGELQADWESVYDEFCKIDFTGKVVGFTSTEGYHYEESEAVIDDKFVGLAIDEGNQGDYTPEKIQNWVSEIKPEFN